MEMTNGQRPILCVDDEPSVLEGLRRTLFEHFDVHTAPSGAVGLDVINSDGPFAVVVSDMRMPGIDGAAFLSRVRETDPDTVRVLLTGYADLDAAIAAVNDGRIFRFLSKPCPPDVLVQSVEEAAAQYRLVTAEKELLERTLNGAVHVLAEVLGVAAPAAFNRSLQIKGYVSHMAERLGVVDRWKCELAAMLCQLGHIALPPETLAKFYAGQAVSAEEQRILDESPEVSHRLLAHIPRLEQVAAMIGCQRGIETELPPEERVGAEILRVALAVDHLVARGSEVRDAVVTLQRKGQHDPRVLGALTDVQVAQQSEVTKVVYVRDLMSSMVLDEDVFSNAGHRIVRKGHIVSAPMIERLKNFVRSVGLVQPIRVRVPAHLHRD